MLTQIMRVGWAQENHDLLQVWASAFQPGGTVEHLRSWGEQQRAATSAETAARLLRTAGTRTSGRPRARSSVPFLSCIPTHDDVVPIEEGRSLVSLIPGSRFVEIDSENHMRLADEPAWPRLVSEIRSFLAESAPAIPARSHDCRSMNSRRANFRSSKELPKACSMRISRSSWRFGENRPEPYYTDLRQDLRQAPLRGNRAGPGSRPRRQQPADPRALMRDICP